ncbi:MAG: 4-alpha-glucanotransferase [Acidobacteria bacterium]|nr:4-alpha-glucanotransferase [Acidobacteriota bacterium]MBV9477630.1 4-alpha-glucanotransferase [Acidobacteriota bacterium]
MHTSAHPQPETPRYAGILLHPTSLPSTYGVGDLGDQLIAFLDWAASAGMRIWQVLPLNPTGYGHSPYNCLSSFAGNPLLISPQRLLQDGLLDADDVVEQPRFSDEHVEFDRVAPYKFALLRRSWDRFQTHASGELRSAFEAFVTAPEQRDWLDDYALFMTLKEFANGAAWWQWDAKLVRRDAKALAAARARHADEIRFWTYVQFLFFRQWNVVRDAAHARGIRIMGDVPIYVAGDSADVWSRPELFQLDDRGRPTVVAGVPPDYFSATGQRWGNPLYRWDVMREANFRWWIARVRTNLRFADLIRLDHFRGFADYWEIQASEPTAVHGRWMPGPGTALFDALRAELGDLPLVAEDLGFITQSVHDLRKAVGLPGMKILQFGFAENDSPHMPHRFEPRTVVYTGTHDNDTARGWFAQASDEERETALLYLGCTTADDIAWGLIRAAYTSVAELAIVPAQDVLGLGAEARMNTPGAESNNWSWRLPPTTLVQELALKLRRLAEITGRV